MAGTRMVIISALSPAARLAIEDQNELVSEPSLNLEFHDEDSDAGDEPYKQVILDKQRARELFNYLGVWLHTA